MTETNAHRLVDKLDALATQAQRAGQFEARECYWNAARLAAEVLGLAPQERGEPL